MKKSLIKKGAAFACLAVAAAILLLLGSYAYTDREALYLTPFLHDTNGWELYTVENGVRQTLTIHNVLELAPEQTYYLSRTLTQEMDDEGYTFLKLSSMLPCAVFLNDRLLYTNCPEAVRSIDEISFPDSHNALSGRGEFVRCTLPEAFAKQTITIATTASKPEYDPQLPTIMLSSEMIESDNMTTTISSELIPAAGFAVIALILMAAWLFALFQGISNYQILLPIAAALLQAFSHLRQLDFLSAAYTALDTPLAQFIPAFSLLLPLAYLLFQIEGKRSRAIFGRILGISALITCIAPTAALFGGLPFDSIFLTENEILYCPLLALLFFTVSEARQGNRHMRLFLTGILAEISAVAILCIGSACGKGFYADQIFVALKFIPEHVPSMFFGYCSAALFLLCAFISLYKIIRHTAKVHADLALQTERLAQLDRQLAVQKEFYDARLSHEEEIRSLKHDMDGHLSTLAMLLSEDNPAEAKHYLDGITEAHKRQTARQFSSNPYINVILQRYAAKCEEQHIALTCHIGISDQSLPATELCLILNNALDNALAACLSLPKADRKIKVQAAVRQNMFLLRISNPFHGTIKTAGGLPVTTKAGKGHGYGLSNIRQAAERTGGSMECYVEKDFFVLDVLFPVA